MKPIGTESHWPKTKTYSDVVLVLGAVQLIESVAFGIPLSYFPNYAMGLGATLASIGLFTSSFMFTSTIMSPKLGSLTDLYGRKRIMIIGLIGDIAFGTLTGLAPSWLWLLLIRVINGAVSSAAMISAEALLIDSVPLRTRGEATGFTTSMSMIGRNIGPLFGGTIQWVSYTGGLELLDSYRIPYFVDSLLALLALLLVAWRIKESKPEKSSLEESHGGSSSTAEKIPMSFSFKVLLVHAFVTGMGVGFVMPIMVLFYNDKFGIGPVEIGLTMSVSGFVGLTAGWVAGRLSDRAGRKPVIAVGSFLSRICNFVLPLTADPAQAAGVLSIQSLGFDISMPALRALRADTVPKEARGRFFGMFFTAFTAGDIMGPIIGTYVYDLYRFEQFEVGGLMLPGYGIPFYVNSILGIATTVMLLALVKETTRREAQPENNPV